MTGRFGRLCRRLVYVFEVGFASEVFMMSFCWIEVDVMNLLHVCMIHLKKPAVVQSFLRNNKLHQHIYPPCSGVKRVADTEVSLVFGVFVAG